MSIAHKLVEAGADPTMYWRFPVRRGDILDLDLRDVVQWD